MSDTFSQRLLLARRDLKMQQKELARAAGVSRPYISELERGEATNPTRDVVEKLAEALGVRAEYLLGWTEDPLGEDLPASLAEGRIVYQVASPTTYRLVQEFLDIFTDLSTEDQLMLLNFVRELAERLRRAGDVRIIGD